MRRAGTASAARPARPTCGLTRCLRVLLLGGASLALAAVAHVAGGGRLPAVGILTMTAGLLGLSAVTLTARRCRFGVLLTVLMLQQVLLHLLFDAAARLNVSCGVPSMSAMGHTLHAAMPVCDPSVMAASGRLPDWSMWAAHLVATALTAALLARGEAWLWRVADQIVKAAASAPAGLAAPERDRVITGRPVSRGGSCWRSRAEPRAPPPVLVLS